MHTDSHTTNHHSRQFKDWGKIAQFTFIALLLYLILFKYQAIWFNSLASSFVAIVLEALPFMLIGSLVGGVIEVFVPQRWIVAALPEKKKYTVFLAAGLGLVFPVCECAVVPVVKRLVKKGIPLSAAISYLLAGPIVNPVVGASTLVAYKYDWQILILRLGIGYLIEVVTGLIIDLIFTKKNALIPELAGDPKISLDLKVKQSGPSLIERFWQMFRTATGDFLDMTRFLIVGAFIAAALQTIFSRQHLADTIAGTEATSILFMMLLAIILNLCSEADAFVAASFQGSPISLTAQLAFLILGPMFDLKLLLMYFRLFRKRLIVTLSVLVLTLVFISVMLVGRLTGGGL